MGAMFSITGLVLSLISIIITLAAREIKGLTYNYNGTKVINVKEKAKNKIKIFYNSRPIEDAYFLVLKFWNSGNKAINKEDFDDPISFSFGDKAEILDYDLIDTIPNNLSSKIKINTSGNTLKIDPFLFNKGSKISLKVMISNFGGVVDAEVLISGIGKIKKTDDNKSNKTMLRLNSLVLAQPLVLLPATLIFSGVSILTNSYTKPFDIYSFGLNNLNIGVTTLLSSIFGVIGLVLYFRRLLRNDKAIEELI